MKTRTSAFRLTLLSACLAAALPVALQAQPPRGADVPEAVRMARPSAEEVSQAQQALRGMLENADADTQALAQKYPDLFQVTPPGVSTVIPSLNIRFLPQHEQQKARAAQGNIDLLFTGDSITDWWDMESGPYAGKAVFDQYFGDMNAVTFGIAGDTTQGLLYRLQNGEGEGFDPKAVMLMIGTNNTASNTAGEIAEGIGAIVLDMQTRWPDTKILLLAIFPRGEPDHIARPEIAQINAIISKLHDGEQVHYMDIGEVFMEEDGSIPRDVMSDLLHPSPKGYELWAGAVKDKLVELVGG